MTGRIQPPVSGPSFGANPSFSDLLRATPQIKDVHFWAQLPGEPVDSGSERIAYLAEKVVPQVRAALAAAP